MKKRKREGEDAQTKRAAVEWTDGDRKRSKDGQEGEEVRMTSGRLNAGRSLGCRMPNTHAKRRDRSDVIRRGWRGRRRRAADQVDEPAGSGRAWRWGWGRAGWWAVRCDEKRQVAVAPVCREVSRMQKKKNEETISAIWSVIGDRGTCCRPNQAREREREQVMQANWRTLKPVSKATTRQQRLVKVW